LIANESLMSQTGVVYTATQYEVFATRLAAGDSKADAARIALGITGSKARWAGFRMAKGAGVAQRVAELLAGQTEVTRYPTAAQSVTRQWVIEQLVRNVEDARADKQYSVVVKSVELAARVAQVWTPTEERKISFPKDLSQATDEELEAFQEMILGPDEAQRKRLLRRLELERGVVIEGKVERAEGPEMEF
jgi:hypothetical protein